MSSLSAPGVLIPAKTPPAEKPLAEETVPFGTDAMGSVMAIVCWVPSQLLRNRRPGYLALRKASVDREPSEKRHTHASGCDQELFVPDRFG